MKRFKLHWRDGTTQIVEGNDIADACNKAGIGNGALPALDHYEIIKFKIIKVEIPFMEGPPFRPREFNSLDQAQAFLSGIKKPELGYLKTDFVIYWEDGNTYRGRYDIGSDEPTLKMHIERHLQMCSCQFRPSHFGPKDWQHWCERMEKEGFKTAAIEFMQYYELTSAN